MAVGQEKQMQLNGKQYKCLPNGSGECPKFLLMTKEDTILSQMHVEEE